jgi:surface protein
MFYYCSSLVSVDISNFKISSKATIDYMFYYCYKLSSLDLSNLNISLINSMIYTFSGCSSLEYINFLNANMDISIPRTDFLYGTSDNLMVCVKIDDSNTFFNGVKLYINCLYNYSKVNQYTCYRKISNEDYGKDICKICGKRFTPFHSGDIDLYCSFDCYSVGKKQYDREYRQKS